MASCLDMLLYVKNGNIWTETINGSMDELLGCAVGSPPHVIFNKCGIGYDVEYSHSFDGIRCYRVLAIHFSL